MTPRCGKGSRWGAGAVSSLVSVSILLAQARDRCASRNPSLPEIDRASDPEAAFPEVGEGDRPGFQNGPEVSECSHRGAAGEARAAVGAGA